MLFIESPIFKEDVDDLLTEDEFFKFQLHLTELPERVVVCGSSTTTSIQPRRSACC